ncbi:MAG: ABC transporter ATP-binding protein [Lachnospira sp.]
MSIISFNNVSFAYASSDKMALEDVSFAINKGEFNIIIGASGSGKTTLLRLMKERTAPAGRRTGLVNNPSGHVGYVSQEPDNQIVMDTVWHELAFGLENMGVDSDSIRKRVSEMAEYMDINDWYEKNVDELSGGQKQLLNLASVMVMQPEVLLLDEPTAQLDPPAAKKFIQTVIDLNRDLGVTVVMVEHHLENVFHLADNIMVMEDGKLIFMGNPRAAAEYIIDGNNPLKQALPCAARIAGRLGHVSADDTRSGSDAILKDFVLPLSVREGRNYINSIMADKKKNKQPDGISDINPDKRFYADNSVMPNSEDFDAAVPGKEEFAIEADKLEFTYAKGLPDVLNRLDLKIKKGSVTALLGGNGAGKSTLLKLCSGVYKPAKGKLKINGKVRLLPQDVMSVFTEISVEEELAEVLLDKRQSGFNLSTQEKIAKVDDMLNKMGLSEHRKMHPYDLSGGQKQKLAIGKMLLMEPEILLLDEPTKGLDPFFKKELGNWLTGEQFAGMTVVIVTHDVDFAAEFAEYCGLLFNGDVVSMMSANLFFSGNMFFTTNVNRIMREYFPTCVSIKDVEEIN